jgi:hypothetical protein
MHGLANLLWRLRRATAIEMGLFDIQGEFLHACRSRSATYLVNRTPSKLPLEPMVRRTAMAQIEDIIRRPVTKNHHYFPSIRSYDDHQTPVPWRNASCASPTSTRRCLRGWAPGCGRQAAQIIWTLDAIRRPALLQLGRAFASQFLATSEIGTDESGTLIDAARDHPYFKDNRGAPSNMVAIPRQLFSRAKSGRVRTFATGSHGRTRAQGTARRKYCRRDRRLFAHSTLLIICTFNAINYLHF